MADSSVILANVIALYKDMQKKSTAWGIEPRYDIRGRANVINELFGNVQTLTVSGRTVKIIRDDTIPEREVQGATKSDIYIYDPDQLKQNEEESRLYRKRVKQHGH